MIIDDTVEFFISFNLAFCDVYNIPDCEVPDIAWC